MVNQYEIYWVNLLNGKKGQVALDQIRCVDKSRLTKKLGQLSSKEEKKLKQILKEYLID